MGLFLDLWSGRPSSGRPNVFSSPHRHVFPFHPGHTGSYSLIAQIISDLQGLDQKPVLPDLAGHVATVAFSSQDSGQLRLLLPRHGTLVMLKLWNFGTRVSSRLLRHRASKLSLSTLLEKENGEPGSIKEQQQ